MTLDEEIEQLVLRRGVKDVIAALARHCESHGMIVLFRRLNKIYEWLTDTKPAA